MRPVRISNPTVRSALGTDYGALWNAFATNAARGAVGASAEDPGMGELGIDRRVVRTTDKQARLLLAAAIECIDAMPDEARPQCGVYLGLPTVDEPMPQLAAVVDWHEERGRSPLAEHFKHHSAPLGWLAMLNSSAAAHVSTRLRLTGCNGVYSPFGDAGLNALIDAAIAVAEGECAQALVGAVAPKHNPMLDVQYANWCDIGYRLPPSEASACALLSHVGADGGPCVLGFARGFTPTPWNGDAQIDVLATRALAMAGLTREDIGWTIATSPWNEAQSVALEHGLAPFAKTSAVLRIECALGRLGAVAPIIAVGLGVYGLTCGSAWSDDADDTLVVRALERSNVLIIAISPLGQYAAVVIGSAR